jgi:DNA-binding XRE family transcriptional regulator
MINIFAAAKSATQAGRGAYLCRNPSLIRRLRIELRLTQVQAAERCSVSLRTFQRAESGDVVPRSVKISIERSLGMSW